MPPADLTHTSTPLPTQQYDKLKKSQRKAEERVYREAEKAAKQEHRKQEDLKAYKSIMKVG